MKSVLVRIEPKLVEEVDSLVGENGMYHSRNAFFRDAVRARLIQLRAAEISEKTKPIVEKLRKRGYKPKTITREEKKKAADGYLRELDIDPAELK